MFQSNMSHIYYAFVYVPGDVEILLHPRIMRTPQSGYDEERQKKNMTKYMTTSEYETPPVIMTDCIKSCQNSWRYFSTADKKV